jgi:hypothetical protein
MQNVIIGYAIKYLASIVLGSGVFERILAVVERWAQEKASGAAKRHGVLDELEVIGLGLTESLARLGIELAVRYVKTKA